MQLYSDLSTRPPTVLDPPVVLANFIALSPADIPPSPLTPSGTAQAS